MENHILDEDNITTEMAKTIDIDLKDILLTYSEIGIDSILDDGILKEIPIIGTISSLYRTGRNLYVKNLLLQTLTFLKSLNDGIINEEKLAKYRERISDKKVAEDELGRVVLLLNQEIDIQKSIYLAKLFAAYINQEISWDKFSELTESNRRLFLQDINFLFNEYYSINKDKQNITYEQTSINRLISIGMLQYKERIDAVSIIGGVRRQQPSIVKTIILTSFGKCFCNICALNSSMK